MYDLTPIPAYRYLASLLTLLALTVPWGPLYAVGLNDTGITTFGNASQNDLTTEPTDYPGQDASSGRDAAFHAGTLTKIGSGPAGFDYTKIANDGTALPANTTRLGTAAGEWACTRDNVSGLTWEVKTNDGGLRDQDWTYTWYDSNTTTNGGNAGVANGGSCYNGRCDTEKYTADVNAAGLCGYHDWRMPTKKELVSIVNYGNSNPSISIGYFPNTPASYFWSASASAYDSGNAWFVSFDVGGASTFNKGNSFQVRLARAGQ
ncbi:DUF1566 domain-containing protein [Gammaproteobacteria bacterium]